MIIQLKQNLKEIQLLPSISKQNITIFQEVKLHKIIKNNK